MGRWSLNGTTLGGGLGSLVQHHSAAGGKFSVLSPWMDFGGPEKHLAGEERGGLTVPAWNYPEGGLRDSVQHPLGGGEDPLHFPLRGILGRLGSILLGRKRVG